MPNLSFFMVASESSECIHRVIDSIESAIANYPIKYTYEVLISSFEEVKYKDVIWVEDALKQPGNTVQALNSLVPVSTGEYVVLLSDDHMIHPNCPRIIEHLNSDLYKDRKYKVSGIGAGPRTMSYENRMGATAILNVDYWNREPGRFPDHAAFPEELKDPKFCNYDHRFLITGYPAFARETIEKIGNVVFNPSFKHHFADNFVSLFFGMADGHIPIMEDNALTWCPRPGTTSTTNNDLYDYLIYCKLAVKLLKEGCDYDEVVTIV